MERLLAEGGPVRLSRRGLAVALGAGAIGMAAARSGRPSRAAGARRAATPAPGTDDDPFRDLLGLVPDPFPAASAQVTPLAYYADIAGQIASVGLTPPTDPESEDARLWLRAILGLQYAPEVADLVFDPLLVTDFGWSPYEVDQSLWFGEPPARTVLLRGRFDAAAVEAALLKLGYLDREIPGAVAAYSIEHKELDFGVPAERYLLTSALQTLAILPDGTFVWSQHPDGARAVAAVAGGAPALTRRAIVSTLLDAIEAPLASSMLVPGLALTGGPGDPAVFLDAAQTPGAVDAMATAMAEAEAERQRMPPVGLALFGVTYGGAVFNAEGTPEALPVEPPPTRLRFYLHVGSEDAAARAVPVIEERLATGRSITSEQPWSDLFLDWTVSVVPERGVVLVEVDPGARRNLWYALLFNRDLGFLAW